ncbi:MAG: guanylate kinase [Planctomycetota bacterium]
MHRLPTDTDNGMLLIMSGPSGVGKTTIARAIERTIADAVFSVSATTRQPRPGDTEGVDYYFLAPDEFERRVQAGEFLEHAEFAGNHYGTLRAPAEEQLRRGRLMLLDIDVEGAKQIKAQIPDAFAIFILPPSEDELLKRLRERKSDSEEAITKRFEVARHEIAEAKRSGAYDAFIVNDTLERAIEEALSLITAARK